MGEEKAAEHLKELNVTTALSKIIVTGYKALGLQYFFTAGHDEVRRKRLFGQHNLEISVVELW